jgi:hypothetical protein
MSGPVVSVILERAVRLPYADRRELVRGIARSLVEVSMRQPGAAKTTASGEDMIEVLCADIRSLIPEPITVTGSTGAMCAAEGIRDVRAEEAGGNGPRRGFSGQRSAELREPLA